MRVGVSGAAVVAERAAASPQPHEFQLATRRHGCRGHYVGIHTSNFRDFLLKPELLRAIVDCGFENPSEGV